MNVPTRPSGVVRRAAPGVLALATLLVVGAATLPAAQASGRAASSMLPGASQASNSAPLWGQLSAPQHNALQPLAAEWDRISGSGKEKWLEIATRYPNLPAAEQQRLHERMAEWVRLTPQQRTEARINFQQSRQLSPQERAARWEAYQALSPEQKQALAQRAKPAASGAVASASRPAPRVDAVQPKSNVVAADPAATGVRPVAPVVLQARPGATTQLLTASAPRPSHQPSGSPKIAAGPVDVDPATLLPRRAPQSQPARPPAVQPARPLPATGASAASPPLAATSAAPPAP